MIVFVGAPLSMVQTGQGGGNYVLHDPAICFVNRKFKRDILR